jgi:hypothetical protein
LVKRIYLKPDSVVISGSAEIIKKTDYIKTERKVLENLSSNTSFQLRLINNYPAASLKYSQNTVGVYIPVAKMVSDRMELKVTPDSTLIGTDGFIEPARVTLYYEVSNIAQKQITQDSFLLVVSKNEIMPNKPGFLKVIARKIPDNIRVIRMEPDCVELLNKKP